MSLWDDFSGWFSDKYDATKSWLSEKHNTVKTTVNNIANSLYENTGLKRGVDWVKNQYHGSKLEKGVNWFADTTVGKVLGWIGKQVWKYKFTLLLIGAAAIAFFLPIPALAIGTLESGEIALIVASGFRVAIFIVSFVSSLLHGVYTWASGKWRGRVGYLERKNTQLQANAEDQQRLLNEEQAAHRHTQNERGANQGENVLLQMINQTSKEIVQQQQLDENVVVAIDAIEAHANRLDHLVGQAEQAELPQEAVHNGNGLGVVGLFAQLNGASDDSSDDENEFGGGLRRRNFAIRQP